MQGDGNAPKFPLFSLSENEGISFLIVGILMLHANLKRKIETSFACVHVSPG
jgi:hypothetical protein